VCVCVCVCLCGSEKRGPRKNTVCAYLCAWSHSSRPRGRIQVRPLHTVSANRPNAEISPSVFFFFLIASAKKMHCFAQHCFRRVHGAVRSRPRIAPQASRFDCRAEKPKNIPENGYGGLLRKIPKSESSIFRKIRLILDRVRGNETQRSAPRAARRLVECRFLL
jgi:hypothetical protein